MPDEISVMVMKIDRRAENKYDKTLKTAITAFFVFVIVMKLFKITNYEKHLEPYEHILLFIMWLIIISIALLFIIIKIKYRTKSPRKIGQLDVDINETIVRLEDNRFAIDHKQYFILFTDNGYDGKSNYTPLHPNSAYDKDNGLNAIKYINKTNGNDFYAFDIYIDTYRRMDALLEITSKANNNPQ